MVETTERIRELSEKKADLVSIGLSDEIKGNLQRRNRLKGIAMQKMILQTFKNKKEDISINKIFELVNEKAKDFYIVQVPIKINDKIYDTKHEFIDIDELKDYLFIFLREKIISKKWKQCSECGKFCLASWLEEKKKKKCWVCRKGHFNYVTKEYSQWLLESKGTKLEIMAMLVETGYLKNAHDKLKKRVDFFRFANRVFYVYESKNKENSGLLFNDLVSALIYPLVIRKSGYIVKDLVLIFNGNITDELIENVKQGFAEKFDFKVKFVPVKEYLENKGYNFEKVRITKQDGKYVYELIEGSTDKIIIDMMELGEWKEN
jgi:hypothetical protein